MMTKIAPLMLCFLFVANAHAKDFSVGSRTSLEVDRPPPERHWLFKPLGRPLKPDQMVQGRCDMLKAYVHGGPGHERASPHYREKHRNRKRNFKGYLMKPPCWITPPPDWTHP